MTQTIEHCNEIPTGKTYPVEHLRTAESIEQLCEYVDAGHPIATCDGNSVMLFYRMSEQAFSLEYFKKAHGKTQNRFQSFFLFNDDLIGNIKLAPIAYRNGRPLHVGGDIEVLRDYGAGAPVFEPCKACCAHATTFNRGENSQEWRFADEVAA